MCCHGDFDLAVENLRSRYKFKQIDLHGPHAFISKDLAENGVMKG